MPSHMNLLIIVISRRTITTRAEKALGILRYDEQLLIGR